MRLSKRVVSLVLAAMILLSCADFQPDFHAFAAQGIKKLSDSAFSTQTNTADADAEWLTDAQILNGNTGLDSVKGDLNLPQSGKYGSAVAWTSGSAAVDALTGKVTRPAYGQSNQQVTLTAVITDAKDSQSASRQKTFSVTVISKEMAAMAANSADQNIVSADCEWLKFNDYEVVRGNGNASTGSITQNIKLPAAGQNGSAITWEANYSPFIAPKGETGKVERPAYRSGDKQFILSAYVKSGTYKKYVEFTITILALPETDQEAVSITNNWLTRDLFLNGNADQQIITKNLYMPKDGKDGCVIEWESDNPSLVATDGTVKRPAYSADSEWFYIKATIRKNSASTWKSWMVTVKKLDPTDAEIVKVDWDALTETVIKGGNSDLNNITTALKLGTKGNLGSTISWTSSNSDVITNDGIVNRPAYSSGDKTVALTANLKKNLEHQTKTFTVKVLKQAATDAETVDADLKWLTEDWASTRDLSHVTGNLEFPRQGQNGSNISWKSSNKAVLSVSADGIGTVAQPPYGGKSAAITLMAAITKNDAHQNKTFTVTVLPKDPNDSQAVAADLAWLTDKLVLKDNTALNNITGNMELPSSGVNHSTIRWTSSKTDFVHTDGTVNCPTYTQKDQSVILTASISRHWDGGAGAEKKFTVTVRALDHTDQEAVDEAAAWLDVGRTLRDNSSQYSVTTNLKFDSAAPNGSEISWISDAPDVISIDGKVTRPGYLAGDKSVKLTAKIKCGGLEKVKTFKYGVLALPDTDAPVIEKCTPVSSGTDVAYDTKQITFTFNEKIKRGSHSDAVCGITAKGTNMPAFSAAVTEKEIVLTLNGELSYGSGCTFTVPKDAVTDLSGNPMKEDFKLSFTVEKKQTNTIEVVSTTPGDRVKNASTGLKELTIRFNRSDIFAGQALNSISLKVRDGAKLSTSCKLSGDTVTLSLQSGAKLRAGLGYELQIPTGAVQDRFKNESIEKTIEFLAGNNTLPEITGVYPANGQKPVDIHQDIQVSFSTTASITAKSVVLKDEKGNTADVTVKNNTPECKAYIQLCQPMKPNTKYTLFIPYGSVVGTNGKNMAFSYSMSFTTGSNSLPVEKWTPSLDTTKGAALGARPEIDFGSPVTGQSLNIKLLDSGGNALSFTQSVSSGKAVLKPSSNFSASETYTVCLSAGACELRFWFKASEKVSFGSATFSVGPSQSHLVDHGMWFNMQQIKNLIESNGYKVSGFKWDFGDGSGSTEAAPGHTYKKAGDYEITLSVTDNMGHAYEFKRTVTAEAYSSDYVKLTVTPNDYEEVWATHDFKSYYAYLSYKGSPVTNETVSMQLYKDGVKLRDYRDEKTWSAGCYHDDENRLHQSAGVAAFGLPTKSITASGNYELRFSYGVGENKKVVSVPLNFVSQQKTADLYIKLVDTGDKDYDPNLQSADFYLDSVNKVTAQPKSDGSLGSCLVIPNVSLTYHRLDLSKSDKSLVSAGYVDPWIYHTGSSNVVYLPVKVRRPGINRVLSEISSSERAFTNDTILLEGVDTPVFNFELDCSRNSKDIGTIEVMSNNGRWKKSMNPIVFKCKPQEVLKAGERMLFRVVSSDGVASAWKDAGIQIAPKPDLGSCVIKYDKDGKYTVSSPFQVGSLISGKCSKFSDIPLLKDVNFGLRDGEYTVNGTMEGRSIDLSLATGHFVSAKDEKKLTKKNSRMAKVKSVGLDVTTDISVRYCLRYNEGTNEWDTIRRSWGLAGGVQKDKSIGYVFKPIDLGIKGTLSIGSNVAAMINIDGLQKKKYSGSITFTPNVGAYISVGSAVAGIRGGVDGDIACKLAVPSGSVSINPSLTAYVKYHVLGKGKKWSDKFFDETWYVTGKNTNLLSLVRMEQTALKQMQSTDDLETLPRDYLNRRSNLLVGQTNLLAAASLAAEEKTAVETLENALYPDAEIQLVRSGDELWAIWTDDNPARTVADNRTQLHYKVLKDSKWSDFEWFGSDNTADFSPSAAAVKDGVLVAWQNSKQELPKDAEISEIAKKSEISVTKNVLGGNTETVTLTDDDRCDSSPRLVADGDKALLVWTKSDGISFDAKNASLYYSKWEDGKWSDAAAVGDNTKNTADYSLAMHGGESLLLYTVDTDGSIATLDDRKLYYRVYNGETWGGAVAVTEEAGTVSNPKAVYSNGKWFIAWSQDGTVYYKNGLNGKTETQDNLSSVGSEYEIALEDGKNPLIALVYPQPGENGSQTLSSSFYDQGSGLWSGAAPLAEGDNESIKSFCPEFTEKEGLKVAYTGAKMTTENKDGVQCPTDSDQVALKVLTYKPAHDLALDGESGLELSKENPLSGTVETVTATILNQGDYAENATVLLYQGDPKNGGVQIGKTSATQTVPARSSAEAEIAWTVGSNTGDTYDLYAVVSPETSVTETDTDNNTIHRAISDADVALSDLECTNVTGNEYLVKATVANKGSRTLQQVSVRLTDQNGKVLKTETVEELTPAQKGSVNLLVSSDGLSKNGEGKISLTLSAGLPDGVTDNVKEDNSCTFDLEPAVIAVEGMNPAPGETAVDVQKPITLTFNRNIEKGAGFDQIKLENQSLDAVNITKKIQDDTLTITPQSALKNSEKYTLSIPVNALGDSWGHSMQSPYSLSFTTTSSSPQVVFAYPGINMEDAPVDSEIKVKFNQSIQKGSSFDSIELAGADSKSISTVATVKDAWLYIKPKMSLAKNVQYSLTVPRGAVANGTGEVQQEAYSLAFTTVGDENAAYAELQSLYNSCKDMEQGNYTDESWAAFTQALSHAKEILQADASQEDISEALAALREAKNGLTQRSSGHHSNSENTKTNPVVSGRDSFQCDTNGTYRFHTNTVYYYKIITTDTVAPTAASSNPLAATVELAQKLPDGYLFKITDIGSGTAVIVTTAADGATTTFTVQGTGASGGITSDTPYYHTLEKGTKYQFKFTLLQGNCTPLFTVGSSIFRLNSIRKEGNTYFVQVEAVVAGSAGVYAVVPGQTIRKCVLTAT